MCQESERKVAAVWELWQGPRMAIVSRGQDKKTVEVQPFGCLIGVSREWLIVHVSENAKEYLGRSAGELLNCPLSDVFTPDAIHAVRGRMQALVGLDSVERVFALDVQGAGMLFDVAVHVTAQATILEIEPSAVDSRAHAIPALRTMLNHLRAADTFDKFCRTAVRYVRATVGFDRVMLCRIDEDGAGEVVAESARPDLARYLGLRYPDQNIPQRERTLYRRSVLRFIPDILAAPSSVLSVPAFGPEPLDLSLSMMRAVSPFDADCVGNTGVRASLSVSVLCRGKLWGLFVCHHESPRHIGYERRSTVELFGQIFSLMLESREHAGKTAAIP